MENAVVSFGLFKQRSFKYGQTYVALSRATSLSGLHIIEKVESKHIWADPRIHEEYQRLREIGSFLFSSRQKLKSTADSKNQSVYLTLFNIRSISNTALTLCMMKPFSAQISFIYRNTT